MPALWPPTGTLDKAGRVHEIGPDHYPAGRPCAVKNLLVAGRPPAREPEKKDRQFTLDELMEALAQGEIT